MNTPDEEMAAELARLSAWQNLEVADQKRGELQKLQLELETLREVCRQSVRALGQITTLANINPETRRMLIEIGNRLNTAAKPDYDSLQDDLP